MRGHTRMHLMSKVDYTKEDNDPPISAIEFFQDAFGERPEWAVHLKGLRTREGLTQFALAEKLGIKQSQISEMETGKRSIGKAFAKKLAEFFHTNYKMFL
jgi:DNA-binding XRE family transcriptional regulator